MRKLFAGVFGAFLVGLGLLWTQPTAAWLVQAPVSAGGNNYVLKAHTIASPATFQTSITSSAIDTTGANYIAFYAAVRSTTTLSVSDSKSNTWTPIKSVSDTGASTLFICAAPCTVGTGHTFTVTGAAFTFQGLAVAAFSGAAASPSDQNNGLDTGFSTTIQPGSVTPSQNNELIVNGWSYLAFGTISSLSIDSGQTILDQTLISGNTGISIALAYELQTTATARNPTWTSNNSDSGNLQAVQGTFK